MSGKEMDNENEIITSSIMAVIVQLKILQYSDKTKFNEICEGKGQDTKNGQDTKKIINELIELSGTNFVPANFAEYSKKVEEVINDKDKGDALKILTNVNNVYMDTIKIVEEEAAKMQREKAKSGGKPNAQPQARSKAQSASKKSSTPKPIPKNKKATNK
jgi:hypothetical protein